MAQVVKINSVTVSPALSGTSIVRLSWRYGFSGAFTTIGDYDINADGTLVSPYSLDFDETINATIQIQFVLPYATCHNTAFIKTYTATSTTTTTTAAPAVQFGTPTSVSGNSTTQSETENLITGTPYSVVTIKVTTYTNTNGGSVTAAGVTLALNTTFTVGLGSAGTSAFATQITGNPANTGTIIRVIFTIDSVDIGAIGAVNTRQFSRTF